MMNRSLRRRHRLSVPLLFALVAMISASATEGADPMAASALPVNPKPGETWTDAHGMTFCWCPPGSARITDREEAHEVIFRAGFWMAKHELTAREAKAIDRQVKLEIEKGKPEEADLELPTSGMDLNSLRRLIRLLNGTPPPVKPGPKVIKNPEKAKREAATAAAEPETRKNQPPKPILAPAGWQYALPTEAEWEYACRSGATTAYSFGDDPALLPKHANFADKSLRDNNQGYSYANRTLNDGTALIAKGGSYPANAWGLHDMHGNLWEWCENGTVRGGGWTSTPEDCRADSRTDQYSGGNERYSRPWLGVRLVLRKPTEPPPVANEKQ